MGCTSKGRRTVAVKIFDFKCNFGHEIEELFRHGEELLDSIPCSKCKEEGREAQMQRVKLYAVSGFNLPTSPGTY